MKDLKGSEHVVGETGTAIDSSLNRKLYDLGNTEDFIDLLEKGGTTLTPDWINKNYEFLDHEDREMRIVRVIQIVAGEHEKDDVFFGDDGLVIYGEIYLMAEDGRVLPTIWEVQLGDVQLGNDVEGLQHQLISYDGIQSHISVYGWLNVGRPFLEKDQATVDAEEGRFYTEEIDGVKYIFDTERQGSIEDKGKDN